MSTVITARHPAAAALLAGTLLLAGTPLLSGCGLLGAPAPSGRATPVASRGPLTGPLTGSPGSDPGAGASGGTTPGGTPSLSSGPEAPVTGDVREATWAGDPQPSAAVLTALRAGTHDGFDRLVLEFDGPVSGYTVRYVDSVSAEPGGQPVPLAGSAFLQVVVQGATTDNAFDTSAAPRRYAGARRVSPDLPVLRQVALAGDFEAVLGVGAGVAGRHPLRVQQLSDPERIVVDVAHG